MRCAKTCCSVIFLQASAAHPRNGGCRRRASPTRRRGNCHDLGDFDPGLYSFACHNQLDRHWERIDRRRLLASHRLPGTSALFLFTTALTSVTGFLFPIHGFTPALGVGIISCVILVVALFAYYSKHLMGAWRWIYVVTAITALYFNVFVLVAQSFTKVAALNALAPTQSEPPFLIAEVAVLMIFILVAI